MTNNCFICLDISNNKVCSTCNITAHHKCWNLFLKNSNNNTTCPQCKTVNFYKIHNTRSTKKIPVHNNKEDCVRYIKNLLDICEDTVGIENRKQITVQIFEYLIVNSWFVYTHDNFKNCLKDKLIQFYQENPNWKYPSQVYMKLFNTQIYI